MNTQGHPFETEGRFPLFPQLAYTIPFRSCLRLWNDLEADQAVRHPRSSHLKPIWLSAPPVLLVDAHDRQEWLNHRIREMYSLFSPAIAQQAYWVHEVPVTSWHTREVQLLRFYYRFIEPARLGLDDPESGEPAWKMAIREIFDSHWLHRHLSQQVAQAGPLTNPLLSKILWGTVSPRTIGRFRAKLRQGSARRPTGAFQGGTPSRITRLDDYR